MSETAIIAASRLKNAVKEAFVKAMENGELIKAELPDFIIDAQGLSARRLRKLRLPLSGTST